MPQTPHNIGVWFDYERNPLIVKGLKDVQIVFLRCYRYILLLPEF